MTLVETYPGVQAPETRPPDNTLGKPSPQNTVHQDSYVGPAVPGTLLSFAKYRGTENLAPSSPFEAPPLYDIPSPLEHIGSPPPLPDMTDVVGRRSIQIGANFIPSDASKSVRNLLSKCSEITGLAAQIDTTIGTIEESVAAFKNGAHTLSETVAAQLDSRVVWATRLAEAWKTLHHSQVTGESNMSQTQTEITMLEQSLTELTQRAATIREELVKVFERTSSQTTERNALTAQLQKGSHSGRTVLEEGMLFDVRADRTVFPADNDEQRLGARLAQLEENIAQDIARTEQHGKEEHSVLEKIKMCEQRLRDARIYLLTLHDEQNGRNETATRLFDLLELLGEDYSACKTSLADKKVPGDWQHGEWLEITPDEKTAQNQVVETELPDNVAQSSSEGEKVSCTQDFAQKAHATTTALIQRYQELCSASEQYMSASVRTACSAPLELVASMVYDANRLHDIAKQYLAYANAQDAVDVRLNAYTNHHGRLTVMLVATQTALEQMRNASEAAVRQNTDIGECHTEALCQLDVLKHQAQTNHTNYSNGLLQRANSYVPTDDDGTDNPALMLELERYFGYGGVTQNRETFDLTSDEMLAREHNIALVRHCNEAREAWARFFSSLPQHVAAYTEHLRNIASALRRTEAELETTLEQSPPGDDETTKRLSVIYQQYQARLSQWENHLLELPLAIAPQAPPEDVSKKPANHLDIIPVVPPHPVPRTRREAKALVKSKKPGFFGKLKSKK